MLSVIFGKGFRWYQLSFGERGEELWKLMYDSWGK